MTGREHEARTAAQPGRHPVEIACDESGYEGERLIGVPNDVFAHAGVHLDAATAVECLWELRARIRSPATEYKANHLLRRKHRAVLVWLLGPSGPLLGNAHVYLIDKAFHVVVCLTRVLTGDGPDRVEAAARTLHRLGPRRFTPGQWTGFLAAANAVLRGKDRLDVRTPVDGLFGALDVLRSAGAPDEVDGILATFGRARPRAEAFREHLRDDPAALPVADPLMPAIVRAVAHWGTAGRHVAIVHDRQTALPQVRVEQLRRIVEGSAATGRLTALSLVDSAVDLRVQVADILAGAVRRTAMEQLDGRGDAEITALVRPYLDASSRWGDDDSWSRLTGEPGARPTPTVP